MKIREHPYYDICFTIDGYSGIKDFDNTYLGTDRFLKNKPEVKLKSIPYTKEEIAMFANWWDTEAKRGRIIFIVDILFFGEYKKFGVQQITPLTNTASSSDIQTVAFNAKIMFDIDSLNNIPPIAIDKTIHIVKNTRDNFIKLGATDFDNDPLEYEVEVCTAYGVLGGEEPTLLYTPDQDFVGEDCFSYIAKDYWTESRPAVVKLIVSEEKIPSHIVKYNLTAPIRVTGNFFYTTSYTGDVSKDKWIRGFGGFIDTTDPDDATKRLPLFIASDDHIMDDRDKVIEYVNVIKWGDRTDYRDYLYNQDKIKRVSVASDAGECKGVLFNRAFMGTTFTDLPVFTMKYGIDFTEMFKNTKIKMYGYLDTESGVRFTRMFSYSAVQKILSISSARGNFFDRMFEYTSALQCIGEIDTRSGISMAAMFLNTNTHIVSPNSQTQALLMQVGGHYLNDLGKCGVNVGKITQTGGSATCKVGTVGGSCVSSATYHIQPSGVHGSIKSINWLITGGTIKSGQGTDTIVVEVSAKYDKKIYLQCIVTDDIHSGTTGNVSFMHRRTYAYLNLTLPKSYKQIVLADFIKAHNPHNVPNIIIKNNVVNCSVRTGNLSGLTVKFINNSELQGFPKGRTNTNYSSNSGFVAESAITVHNNGWIRGAGGYGGQGGKGKTNTYSKNYNAEYYSGTSNVNSWQAYCDSGAIRIFLDGKGTGSDHNCSKTGPYNSPSSSKPGKLYRGKLKWCSGVIYIYSIIRKWTVKKTRYGGDGGLGGRGKGYNQSNQVGVNGKSSNPSGGYSGGRGGSGGDWGQKGATGGNGGGGGSAGKTGYNAAPAITGNSIIHWDKVGNISGSRV